jgi:hypothetical protein
MTRDKGIMSIFRQNVSISKAVIILPFEVGSFLCLDMGQNEYFALKKSRDRHVLRAPSGFNSES